MNNKAVALTKLDTTPRNIVLLWAVLKLNILSAHEFATLSSVDL
jgi:hypothetical protein